VPLTQAAKWDKIGRRQDIINHNALSRINHNALSRQRPAATVISEGKFAAICD